jgi:signal transduction histidine kinase
VVLSLATLTRKLNSLFGELRIRPKLMFLHNVFFLVLAVSVYLSLIPFIEGRVREARERNVGLYISLFANGSTPADLRIDRGNAEAVELPATIRGAVDSEPGTPVRYGEYAYRRPTADGEYERLTLPADFYNDLVRQVRYNLFIALGLIYVLAVVLLELVIMPRYVYRPLRASLRADKAAQSGERDDELIPEEVIPGDEVGDIMRSRNETLVRLREQELNLELAERRMAAQDRLASIGLLGASVAHEINTPLSVLQGSIEQLQESLGDAASQTRLARMRRVSERLRKISQSLLEFAADRRTEEERKPVTVRDLIDEAWGLLAIDKHSSSIEWINRVDPSHAVIGNSGRLVQVFVNLLRNGMNAIEASGRIEVSSERTTDPTGTWVRIAIDDSGVGIPEDVLPNIFEAFVTSRLDAQGTGLGLTVAEGIVQRHGGGLTASNLPKGGARLEVRLPAA